MPLRARTGIRGKVTRLILLVCTNHEVPALPCRGDVVQSLQIGIRSLSTLQIQRWYLVVVAHEIGPGLFQQGAFGWDACGHKDGEEVTSETHRERFHSRSCRSRA